MDACLRQVANWGALKPHNKFDRGTWDLARTAAELPYASPKLAALLDNIARLDEADMRRDGRLYKHFIFSDVKYGYGAKIVVAGLLTRGFEMVFDKGFVIGGAAEGKGMAVLVATQMFGEDVPVRFRKKLIAAFNRRPENVHGAGIRIIVLDSGFKEGIDLFDVKYAHIFEPPATAGDRKQIVGRATRYCGQSGLRFVPGEGWRLHVYTYDTVVPEGLEGLASGQRSLFDAFLMHSKMDGASVRLGDELVRVVRRAAVDAALTQAVHGWDADGGRARKKKAVVKKAAREAPAVQPVTPAPATPTPPTRLMGHADMAAWVAQRYGRYAWPAPEVKNECDAPATPGSAPAPGTGSASTLSAAATFTPTQEFVRQFFKPPSAYKGLLLYHGTGTGKTCCAIATATTSFERAGYTILWVTRTTLRNDLWKNMYEKVCSLTVQESKRGKRGINVADALASPMSYLSKQWLPPISYKMFTNLLAGKNDLYHILEKRNGADVLRRTLVIIDEAHKLFSGDLPTQERPDPATMMERFQTSYATSGKDSVRLLLMSATPWSSDPMDFMKLVNLMREGAGFPTSYDAFAAAYLEGGRFSPAGEARFMDELAGYVSYLNREKDVRQFARPTFHRVDVPLSLDALTAGRAKLEAMGRAIERLEAEHAEQTEVYEQAVAKLKKETGAWERACDRVRQPERRAMCDAQVAQRVQWREDEYIEPMRAAMARHEERIAAAKEELEATRQAMENDPSRLLSQERALGQCAEGRADTV